MSHEGRHLSRLVEERASIVVFLFCSLRQKRECLESMQSKQCQGKDAQERRMKSNERSSSFSSLSPEHESQMWSKYGK